MRAGLWYQGCGISVAVLGLWLANILLWYRKGKPIQGALHMHECEAQYICCRQT